jgi:L-fuconolactonase
VVTQSTNQAWLERTPEPALEPDLPICDPHHHLWDFRPSGVQKRYFVDEMLDDLAGGHNIVSSVFIECGTMFRADGPEEMRCVGETEFANGMAAISASGQYGPSRIAAGIVATAELMLGDKVADVLDAHIAAGNGRVKGIREGAFWHPSPDVRNHRTEPPQSLFLRDDFRAGFKHLAPRGLTFDMLCYHTQIPEAVDLARAFPDTTLILNHLGGPIGVGPYVGKSDDVFAEWRPQIDAIAACPNVMMKLGGVNMDINGYGWEDRPAAPTSAELTEATRRWFDYAIERFGPERCMFESNFPVDKLSCSYTVVWNSFKLLSKGYSASERAAMFHDTAARVYRL